MTKYTGGRRGSRRAMAELAPQSAEPVETRLETHFHIGRRSGQAYIQIGLIIAIAVQLDFRDAIVGHEADIFKRKPFETDIAAVDMAIDAPAILFDARRFRIHAQVRREGMAPADFQ